MSLAPEAPPPRCRIEWHRPRLYRYLVARPAQRFMLNRYPGVVNGAALTVGRYAYCIKWGWAR
jgi:hypothetical protein